MLARVCGALCWNDDSETQMKESKTTAPDGSMLRIREWGPFAISRLENPEGYGSTTYALVLMPWPNARFSVQCLIVIFDKSLTAKTI